MTTRSRLEVCILSGGKGSRLHSLFPNRQKTTLEINQRPFVYYLLRWIQPIKPASVIFALGYQAQEAREQILNCAFDYDLKFSVEDVPRGTGGALKFASKIFKCDLILVMNGDSIVNYDLTRFVDFHCSGKHKISMLGVRVDDGSRFGTIDVADDTSLRSFNEKTNAVEPAIINGGVYIFSKNTLEQLQDASFSLEYDVLPKLKNQICVDVQNADFIDIGTPESFRDAGRFLKQLETIK